MWVVVCKHGRRQDDEGHAAVDRVRVGVVLDVLEAFWNTQWSKVRDVLAPGVRRSGICSAQPCLQQGEDDVLVPALDVDGVLDAADICMSFTGATMASPQLSFPLNSSKTMGV